MAKRKMTPKNISNHASSWKATRIQVQSLAVKAQRIRSTGGESGRKAKKV